MKIIDPLGKLFGDWASNVSIGSILLKLGLAFVLSTIIGLERSSKRHSAGLRTFMVVMLGATLAGIVDVFMIQSFGISLALCSVAIIVALATLSVNSLLITSKNQIRGLTTSAALWVSGILGICIGLGLYTATLVGFVVLLISLSLLPKMERYLKDRSNHFEIHLELANKNNLSDFVETIRKLGLRIDDIEANSAYLNSGLSVYSIALTIISPELKKYKTHNEIISAIKSLEYVKHIEQI